jgi:polysaccharide pyruvyl transferase WcaK-like protein
MDMFILPEWQMPQDVNDRVIKCILLGASLGTNNLGVSALASGAITSLLECHPNSQVKLLDYGRRPDAYTIITEQGPVKVDLINIRFSKRIYLRNNIARLLMTAFLLKLLPQRVRAHIIFRSSVLRLICDADIVASIAGGDSFSDIYGLGRLLYVTLPQLLSLALDKPLILLPQTIGPFNGFLSRRIASYILQRASLVYSRDRQSFKEIGSLIGNVKEPQRILFSYDVAFVLRPSANGVKKPLWVRGNTDISTRIGFNISGLLYMGGYTHDNMFRLKSDYRQLVYAIIQHLTEKHGADIVLVPHVYGSGKDSESDADACREVYEYFKSHPHGNVHFIEDKYNQHQIKFLIGQFDLFLGSRMHACIAALSQCVPAIGLAYSRKFQGVFESIKMGELVIDLCEYDENSVIKFIDKVYQKRLRLKAQLELEMPAVRDSVLSLFKNISTT